MTSNAIAQVNTQTGVSASAVPFFRNKLLVPDKTRRKLRNALALTHPGGCKQPVLNVKSWRSDLQVARNWMEIIPDSFGLNFAIEQFDKAIEGKAASGDECLVLTGLLIDSYPNRGSAVGAGYMDSLTYVLEDHDEEFTPFVLASAVREAIESRPFVPTIFELLTLANQAKRRFVGARHRTEALFDLRYSAEDVMLEAGEVIMEYDDFGLFKGVTNAA